MTLKAAVHCLARLVLFQSSQSLNQIRILAILIDSSWFYSFQENTETLTQNRPEPVSSTTFVILVH
jgi:hypothetical protein